MDSNSSLSKGNLRKLTSAEKLFYPKYTHVTVSDSFYKKEDCELSISKGYLVYILPGMEEYGSSLVFYNYLYSTHRFTSGQQCSRQFANSILEDILSLNSSLKCWIFINLLKLDLFWLFSKFWNSKNSVEYLAYETKKYK